MRLTDKVKKIPIREKFNSQEEFDECLQVCKEHNKLVDLEDVEEKLGIDLITLFKALTNGIQYLTDFGFDKGDFNWTTLEPEYISLSRSMYEPPLGLIFKLQGTPDVHELHLYDYGKRWGLIEDKIEVKVEWRTLK